MEATAASHRITLFLKVAQLSGGVSKTRSPRRLNTNGNVTLLRGGVPGFLCRLLDDVFSADKCGAKKPVALFFDCLGNMGNAGFEAFVNRPGGGVA